MNKDINYINNNYQFIYRVATIIFNKDKTKILLFYGNGRDFYMLPVGKVQELGINNIVAEVTFGNEYSLKNLQGMGYEIKTWYQKDENIKRHILLKRLELR